jgi:hypothetical protein
VESLLNLVSVANFAGKFELERYWDTRAVQLGDASICVLTIGTADLDQIVSRRLKPATRRRIKTSQLE